MKPSTFSEVYLNISALIHKLLMSIRDRDRDIVLLESKVEVYREIIERYRDKYGDIDEAGI